MHPTDKIHGIVPVCCIKNAPHIQAANEAIDINTVEYPDAAPVCLVGTKSIDIDLISKMKLYTTNLQLRFAKDRSS